MLNAYLFCLLSGLVLINLSLNDDGGGDGEGGALSLLFSTPFWSFGLTGFGLSGLLMQLLVRNNGGWLTHLIALTIGGGMGLAAMRVLRMLGQREANSLVRSDDLVGLEGVVTLAMDGEQRGFVEVSIRGTLLRRPALSCNGALAANTKVVVVASDDHTLRVETLQLPEV
ncbi:NfeD class II-like protein [Synechococcus sp. RS9907]|uniref:NfeD family protein n=1 Tax=Synechococcus sp. RS9907 TaxID=221350 RepID=UPI00165E5277|nr:NfeD family protein [Synechococcus sp. RS9907]QNI82484.1 NfeD class II-like protein [Synechococcus sp. RS9907]